MGQNEFRSETGQASAVPNPAAERREQMNWLKDFTIGLALAAGAGVTFVWVMSLGHMAWAALL